MNWLKHAASSAEGGEEKKKKKRLPSAPLTNCPVLPPTFESEDPRPPAADMSVETATFATSCAFEAAFEAVWVAFWAAD